MDSLKKFLTACHIDHRQWTVLSSDRDAWRQTVHQAVCTFEDTCRTVLAAKREWGKNRDTAEPPPDQSFP